jgi:hypothetical protein
MTQGDLGLILSLAQPKVLFDVQVVGRSTLAGRAGRDVTQPNARHAAERGLDQRTLWVGRRLGTHALVGTAAPVVLTAKWPSTTAWITVAEILHTSPFEN